MDIICAHFEYLAHELNINKLAVHVSTCLYLKKISE